MCTVLVTNRGEICARTRLAIVKVDEFGSFCEKECDIDSYVFSKVRVAEWMHEMGPIFDRFKDK